MSTIAFCRPLLLSALVAGLCAGSALAQDGFPVTITGGLGSVVIEQAPTRVLALSGTDADHLLALGVVPLAIPSMPQTDAMTGGTGILPWQRELYPAGLAKVEAPVTNINYESLAALDPDLIVATTYWGLDAESYARLSALAPVVHFDTGTNADPWQDYSRKIAAALGRPEAAEAAIAKAEAAIAAARAAAPELQGRSFNAIISPSDEGVYILCSDDDNLARVTGALGLVLSDYAKTVPCDGGKGEVSWDNVSNLDADLLWVIPDDVEQIAVLDRQPLWPRLGAVQRDALVVVPKTTGVPYALAFPSPLSIAWTVEQLAPQFAAAAARP
jgi:iron complex transport system substrate-binding protein